MKTKTAFLSAILASLLLVAFAPICVLAPKPIPYRPMIFVHGGAGSGAQFESQAMRFTSNGYPANYIAVQEYDSPSVMYILPQIWAGLDQLIATLMEETGTDQVDILGHSLGTFVMQGYLASPLRAAKVAHYVNIDGFPALAPPGGVPTLAIWGMGHGGLEIVGATNVYFLDQTHVQVATSAESFVEMYKFFTGEEPEEKHIVPESGQISLAGRAVIFPQNTGAENAILEIYEVNGDTGTRISNKPKAIYPIGEDGAWGPFKAKSGVHYEFALVREDAATHHLYYEPFIRSDYLIRLLTSIPGEGVAAYMNTSDYHSNLVITRYKEFWGDQGVNNDILEINGVNIVNAAIFPQSKLVNGIFAYDKDADGESNLNAPIPYYFALTFMTGVDIYIPGADPPTGTISLVSWARGMPGNSRVVINFPNWASTNHRISVNFNDYHLVE